MSYLLQCVECEKTAPIAATEEEELTIPDFEEMEETMSCIAVDLMREFYEKHTEHGLRVVPYASADSFGRSKS